MRADPLVLLDGGRGARLERAVTRRAPDRALLAVNHLDVRHQTEIVFFRQSNTQGWTRFGPNRPTADMEGNVFIFGCF